MTSSAKDRNRCMHLPTSTADDRTTQPGADGRAAQLSLGLHLGLATKSSASLPKILSAIRMGMQAIAEPVTEVAGNDIGRPPH